MPNFLDNAFARLRRDAAQVVAREIQGSSFANVTGQELLNQIRAARRFLRQAGMQAGDRCALLAPNSIRWLAIDLALLAEGVIVVPLYSRQEPAELVTMMKDCQPRLLIAGDAQLAKAVSCLSPAGPSAVLFEQVLSDETRSEEIGESPNPRADDDLVKIIYTSGTSGEPKGVCLNTGNVSFMLTRTRERLDQLMRGHHGQESVFHYLPLNFAASWIASLSFLSRNSVLTFSSDLTRLADELALGSPNYFLNVPTFPERVRRGVEENIAKRPAPLRFLFGKARDAWQRQRGGRARAADSAWFLLGRRVIFQQIRKRFGSQLRALICGSAPLSPETQQFFLMLGIPILQVYGLTETTGICTMDDPCIPVEPGHVGPAIDGIEMKIGENEEILVRGPHIFPGYWNRDKETAAVLRDGWFHTGDRGEVNVRGNWRIVGRIKNLIILNSGHNIAPEPIEEKILNRLVGAQHVVLVGNGRGYLCAVISGEVERPAVQAALDGVNAELPHYRQIRKFAIVREAFSAENGLLTSNSKLRRDAINLRFAPEISAMYDLQEKAAQKSA